MMLQALAPACRATLTLDPDMACLQLRDAAEATAKAAARLAAHFEGVEARLQDAKALAAACCEPALTPAEKVRGIFAVGAHICSRPFEVAGA